METIVIKIDYSKPIKKSDLEAITSDIYNLLCLKKQDKKNTYIKYSFDA